MKKVFFITLVVFMSILVSCGLDKEEDGSSDSNLTDAVDVEDQVIEETKRHAGVFSVIETMDIKFSHHLHKQGSGNLNMSCSIATVDGGNVSADEDIVCWLDVEEQDLFHFGASLELNVKEGICDYVVFNPFYYYNFPFGTSNRSITLESCNDLADFCRYDYSYIEGPNCDSGVVSCTDSKGETTFYQCGGHFYNCRDGALKDVIDLKYTGVIYHIDEEAFTQNWELNSPYWLGYSDNQYLSNYTKQCSSTSGGAASDDLYNTDGIRNYAKEKFTNLASIADASNILTDPFAGNPLYSFYCYDRAYDVKARIQIVIREWNRIFLSSDSSVEEGIPSLLMDDDSIEPGGSYGDYADRDDWDDNILTSLDCSLGIPTGGFSFPLVRVTPPPEAK